MNLKITKVNVSAGAPKAPARQTQQKNVHPEKGFFSGVRDAIKTKPFATAAVVLGLAYLTFNATGCSSKKIDPTPNGNQTSISSQTDMNAESYPGLLTPTNLFTYRDTGMTIWNYEKGADGSITYNPCVSARVSSASDKPVLITKIEVTIDGRTEVSTPGENERLIMPGLSSMLSMKGPLANGYVPFGTEKPVTVKLTYSEILPDPTQPGKTVLSLPVTETGTFKAPVADWGNKQIVQRYATQVPVSEVLATPQLLTALFGNSQAQAIQNAHEHQLLAGDGIISDIVSKMQAAVTRSNSARQNELKVTFASRIGYLDNVAFFGLPGSPLRPGAYSEETTLTPGIFGSTAFSLQGAVRINAVGAVHNWSQDRTMDVTFVLSRALNGISKITINGVETPIRNVSVGRGETLSLHSVKLPPVTASFSNEESFSVTIKHAGGSESFTLNLVSGANVTGSGPMQGFISLGSGF